MVIPSFCCTAVVPPILAVGAQPVLADVGSDLNLTADTVAAALTGRTRAVIVPHLFGNPAAIDEIAALARKREIRVIDDAAQALGATWNGGPAGSFGDAGILSFGADKICSGIGGGAMISRSGDLSHVRARLSVHRPSAAESFGRFASAWSRRRWKRWTVLHDRVKSAKGSRDPTAPPPPYMRRGMDDRSAAIACDLMESLSANVAARRKRAASYRALLGALPGVELVPHRAGSACLTQVARCRPQHSDDDAAARTVSALRARGHEVQGSYMPIHLLASLPAVWDALPHTDRVWCDLVELPCGPEVSMTGVEEIAAAVEETMSRRLDRRACRASRKAVAEPLFGRRDGH